MPIFAPPHFAADQAGCPTCKLELVPHPDGGRWICPQCRWERATLHERVTAVSTRPAIAAVLKVMTETLATIRTEGAQSVDEQTTPADDASEGLAEPGARPAWMPGPGPAWISVIELAKRWGVSTYIATHRLREHEVPSLRTLDGKLVVDRADVAAWPTEAPPAKRLGYGSGNGATIETPKAEPAPTASAEPAAPADQDETFGDVLERIRAEEATRKAQPATPSPAKAPPPDEHPAATVDLKVFVGDDRGRVRRLLLVLEHIERMSNKYLDDPWILPAIAALARYAIAAES